MGSSMFGERMDYTLHFYLSDSTIEIKEKQRSNTGRDPFPMLMSRCKVRHMGNDKSSWDAMGNIPESEYYSAADLKVGCTISVLSRVLRLVDCDSFTRQYYQDQGIEQGSACY